MVDRGTGSYTGDAALRERLRSSSSHSVLLADGRTQNPPVPGRPFGRTDRAKPFLTSFDPAGAGSVELGHHGWCRPPGALSVLRRLALDEDGTLTVRDELRGKGRHRLELLVQWAPGWEPAPARAGASRLEACGPEGRRAILRLPEGVLDVLGEPVDHSPRQGRVVPACRTRAWLETELPAVVEHALLLPAPPEPV